MSDHYTGIVVKLYPHPGGCAGCRAERVCNYCAADLKPRERCTNGRCAICHSLVCTTGGAESPGHGYGKQGT